MNQLTPNEENEAPLNSGPNGLELAEGGRQTTLSGCSVDKLWKYTLRTYARVLDVRCGPRCPDGLRRLFLIENSAKLRKLYVQRT